ncbi:MAG TPA: 50S ribosomal protein L11 methyltransferase [Candidatus Polarisedimenticolaceae bacterium]|nr:50S ribosomal protein L11 methyltransferase [Candidatus Polarisedimenticolaceae bacterium]
MKRTGWAALAFQIPVALEEQLLQALAQGSLGSETRFASPGRCELLLYFQDVLTAAARVPDAHATLRAHGLDPAASRVRVVEVPDGRWAERWQEGLRPFPLGTRFAVHPSGVRDGLEERKPILLVPGRAFGTGEHGTTRLAAEALERHVAPGSAWLDLGTGTGLLALIAHHLGAGRVVARDTDADAVEVAREVLQVNGAADMVELALGSMERLAPASFDGVAANIVAPFFLAHATEVAALLRPAGVLLATGLLEDEATQIRRVLEHAGLHLEGMERALPWILLVARKPS